MISNDDILDTAEKVVQQHGPEKANVVDIAHALDISHGTIYHRFSDKEELREAVVRRWLGRMETRLAQVGHSRESSQAEKLRRWVQHLVNIRREKRRNEPELFALYCHLNDEARGVTEEHSDHLVEQLAAIIRPDTRSHAPSLWDHSPRDVARAICDATARFHHPAHADEWDDPEIGKAFESVWRLIQTGLSQPNGLLKK